MGKNDNDTHILDIHIYLKPFQKVPKLETDVTVTDLEEECPNIENLIIKTKSLTESPKKLPSPRSKSPKKSEKSPPATTAGKAVVEKAVSETSTPRTADRTCTLFEGRVSTPKLKNIGSRHHLDRTTHKWQNERFGFHTSILVSFNAFLATW